MNCWKQLHKCSIMPSFQYIIPQSSKITLDTTTFPPFFPPSMILVSIYLSSMTCASFFTYAVLWFLWRSSLKRISCKTSISGRWLNTIRITTASFWPQLLQELEEQEHYVHICVVCTTYFVKIVWSKTTYKSTYIYTYHATYPFVCQSVDYVEKIGTNYIGLPEGCKEHIRNRLQTPPLICHRTGPNILICFLWYK